MDEFELREDVVHVKLDNVHGELPDEHAHLYQWLTIRVAWCDELNIGALVHQWIAGFDEEVLVQVFETENLLFPSIAQLAFVYFE